MKCTVLGAGRVGRAIAYDLARDSTWEVTVADWSDGALAGLGAELSGQRLDLGTPGALEAVIRGDDIVVGALPSFLGFETLRRVVSEGKKFVDISFSEEDPFLLDELAKSQGAVVVVDCGVAPGLDNILLGRATQTFESVDRFVCQVGGIPALRNLPWEYKAPFAPYDVLNEYTRPARLVEGGQVVVKPALSDLELVDFPGVGTLEAFNTDGLRTLLTTVDVPSMKEMTLRYPGHADRVRLLRESGFLSTKPRTVQGVEVTPLAMTSELLFEQWRLRDEDDELTAMRVEIEGRLEGETQRYLFELLDRRDPTTGLSSMARSTGFTCSAVTRAVAEGAFARPGISAPEHVGQEANCAERILADLAERGIAWSEETTPVEAP